MWPGCIIQQLSKLLPPEYIAEPRVHLGTEMEIDIGALEIEIDDVPTFGESSDRGEGGIATATATATWTKTFPVVAVDTDRPDEYEYEVRIYDMDRERQLVAAIELISPVNQDRPETRMAFVAKCAFVLCV